MAAYFRPTTLNDALRLMAAQPCRVLAGGTDFYAAQSTASAWAQPGLAQPSAPPTLDITDVGELYGIERNAEHIVIGACTRWSDLHTADLPSGFDALRDAAREIGGVQIQNRATLAGNLCNASPAADGVPPLLALDARVKLRSLDTQRELPLREFLIANRQTARRDDELLTRIIIPQPAPSSRSVFLKLGARRYLVISIAMVALVVNTDEHERISSIGIAVGACSATAQRLLDLEKRLLGAPLSNAAQWVRSEDFLGLEPIDDVRASADYRRHAAKVLVRRALGALAKPSHSTTELLERSAL